MNTITSMTKTEQRRLREAVAEAIEVRRVLIDAWRWERIDEPWPEARVNIARWERDIKAWKRLALKYG